MPSGSYRYTLPPVRKETPTVLGIQRLLHTEQRALDVQLDRHVLLSRSHALSKYVDAFQDLDRRQCPGFLRDLVFHVTVDQEGASGALTVYQDITIPPGQRGEDLLDALHLLFDLLPLALVVHVLSYAPQRRVVERAVGKRSLPLQVGRGDLVERSAHVAVQLARQRQRLVEVRPPQRACRLDDVVAPGEPPGLVAPVQRPAEHAPGQPDDQVRPLRRNVLVLEQVLLELVERDVREGDLLAARADGRQHGPGAGAHQYEDDVPRRLLEHLEQGRGALLPHAVCALDDVDLSRGLHRLLERVHPQRADGLYRDVLSRRAHHHQVGMLLLHHPATGVALPAPTARAEDRGRERLRHDELAHRGRPGEHVGVIDPIAFHRADERGSYGRVADDVVPEHRCETPVRWT